MGFLDNAAEQHALEAVERYNNAQAAAGPDEKFVDVAIRIRSGKLVYQERTINRVAPDALLALYDLAEIYLSMYTVVHVDAQSSRDAEYRNRVFLRLDNQSTISVVVFDHEPTQTSSTEA